MTDAQFANIGMKFNNTISFWNTHLIKIGCWSRKVHLDAIWQFPCHVWCFRTSHTRSIQHVEGSALPEAHTQPPQTSDVSNSHLFVAMAACQGLAFVDSMSQVGKLQDKFLSWKISQVILDQSTALKYEFPRTRPDYLYCSQHDFITPRKCDQTPPWCDSSVEYNELNVKVSKSLTLRGIQRS